MRIKSMMRGMLAVVMAMSMEACSGAPAADQTSSDLIYKTDNDTISVICKKAEKI